MTIEGKSFGPVGTKYTEDVQVSKGGKDNCTDVTVTVESTEMTCEMPAGVGQGFNLRTWIDGQATRTPAGVVYPNIAELWYQDPEVYDITHIDTDFSTSPSTVHADAGYDYMGPWVTITGVNFGPQGESDDTSDPRIDFVSGACQNDYGSVMLFLRLVRI